MTQHRDAIENYACDKSSSPSDADFIKGHVNFGYSLAESHYKAMMKRMADGLRELVRCLPVDIGVNRISVPATLAEYQLSVDSAKQLLTEYEQSKQQP